MNILFIGDVVGKPGRDAVKYFLENNAEALGLDFVIANLENVSHGKGLQKNHFLEMMESGMDDQRLCKVAVFDSFEHLTSGDVYTYELRIPLTADNIGA